MKTKQPIILLAIRKIIYIMLNLLTFFPFHKKIIALLGFNWAYKQNFGKIKFQGQFFQDLFAYIYFKNNFNGNSQLSQINGEGEGTINKNGFFIDIGAYDGIIGSNTYIFEQIGWKGICIEPQPNIFRQLKRNRKCDLYNIALSSHSSENVEFFQAHNAPALSGINEGMEDTHKNWAKEYGKVDIIKIRTVTFDKLMENYPDLKYIDFISIDVEGHEMEILETINFEKYKFGLITIENSDPEKIKNLMCKNGYKKFMEVGVDIMFIPNN